MDTPTASTTFDHLAYNPQCFALYTDRLQPPEQWKNVCPINFKVLDQYYVINIIGVGEIPEK